MRTSPSKLAIIGLLAGGSILFPGCSITLDPPAGNPSDDGAPGEVPNAQAFVTVHFRNFAETDAVDVEFYMTDQPLAVVPDDLFVDAFRLRAGIGVAGTGIIEPLSEDVAEFPCGPGLLLGTAGGRFLDNESGDPQGFGTPRWAEEAALGFCGGAISLDFIKRGNGTFDTVVQIVD